MNTPVIELLGLPVRAPVTTVTNAILAAQCLALAAILGDRSGMRSRLWSLFFLFLGLGASAGMPKHGIPDGAFQGLRHAAVVTSNLGVATATTVLVLLGVGAIVTGSGARRVLVAVALIQLVLFAAITFRHPAFVLVAANAAIGLTLVALTGVRRLLGRRSPACGWILAVVAVVAVVAGVHFWEVRIGPWVDHVDLGHGLVALALLLLYRAALHDDGASWTT